MKIKFYGTRGSVPTPDPDYSQFGGNTSCIQITFSSGRIAILDAGTGIRNLWYDLIKHSHEQYDNINIILSHTHWDHIIGFPFFRPIYIPGTKLKVYGPITFEDDSLEMIMGDLLRYRYFPVLHGELTANIEYLQLGECKMDLGDGIKLKTKYLNHPLLCLGFWFGFNCKF